MILPCAMDTPYRIEYLTEAGEFCETTPFTTYAEMRAEFDKLMGDPDIKSIWSIGPDDETA